MPERKMEFFAQIVVRGRMRPASAQIDTYPEGA